MYKDLRLTYRLCNTIKAVIINNDDPLDKQIYKAFENVICQVNGIADFRLPKSMRVNVMETVDMDRIIAAIIDRFYQVRLCVRKDRTLRLLTVSAGDEESRTYITKHEIGKVIKKVAEIIDIPEKDLSTRKVIQYLYQTADETEIPFLAKNPTQGHLFTGLEESDARTMKDALAMISPDGKPYLLTDLILKTQYPDKLTDFDFSYIKIGGPDNALSVLKAILESLPIPINRCTRSMPRNEAKLADSLLSIHSQTDAFSETWLVDAFEEPYGVIARVHDMAATCRSFTSRHLPYPDAVPGPKLLILLSSEEPNPDIRLTDDDTSIENARALIKPFINNFDTMQGILKYLHHEKVKGSQDHE